MNLIELKIYNTFEQTGVQLEEWKNLLNFCVSPSIFMLPEFVLPALEYLPYSKEKTKFLVFRHKSSNELIGMFIFTITRGKWKRLYFNKMRYTISNEADKPYPIIHKNFESDCWEMVIKYFIKYRSEWDIIEFMELPSESPVYQQIKKLCSYPRFYWMEKSDNSGPIVNLELPWEEFSSSHKKMRKKIRKMLNDFEPDFKFKVSSDDSIEKYLDDYLQIEKKSWKPQEGIGISYEAAITAFYRKFLSELAKLKSVLIAIIYIGDQPISGEIAYIHGKTVYFSHGCYDPIFKKYSPGMVSTALLIKHLCAKGYKKGDFLAGYAHYITPWAQEIIHTKRMIVCKLTVRMVSVLILSYLKRKFTLLLTFNLPKKQVKLY